MMTLICPFGKLAESQMIARARSPCIRHILESKATVTAEQLVLSSKDGAPQLA